MLANNYLQSNLLGTLHSHKKSAPWKKTGAHKANVATAIANETAVAAAKKRKLVEATMLASEPTGVPCDKKQRPPEPPAAEPSVAVDLATEPAVEAEVFVPRYFEEHAALVKTESKPRFRDGVAVEHAKLKFSGAIVAPNRTSEQSKLHVGDRRTCLVDATKHAADLLAPGAVSRAKLITSAIPTLGNTLEATPDSINKGLAKQEAPFMLAEATTRFRRKGGCMSHIASAPDGVFVVTLHVNIDGKPSRHAVCVSKMAEEHAQYGKILDNHSKPVYFEKTESKKSACKAFRSVVTQRIDEQKHTIGVNIAEIFEVVRV